ncbi:DUF3644 domain-containing protein [Enterobacteriaceae bacterium ML5]|nr:DUF3644 domain-containing protein [Enterobacteriaceae bacterium ML5]
MKFTSQDIKIFDEVFSTPYSAGYILDFTDKSMREFFDEEFAINIEDELYKKDGVSKAKRLRCFIKETNRETVLEVLAKLWQHRKKINSPALIPQEEMLFAQLIERLKNADVISSFGIPPARTERINTIDYKYLINELELMKSMTPQERGYRFESWLNELFSAFSLSPKAGFRIIGEQIDGSFNLHNEIYLVEAKSHSLKTSANDLHVFQGKLDQKATWTRGVFISWQGFSSEAFAAWGRNKSIVCVTGYDLYHMLMNNISLIDMFEKKIRLAAEKGDYCVSIDILYPEIFNK